MVTAARIGHVTERQIARGNPAWLVEEGRGP
jgi:hypothetical protein